MFYFIHFFQTVANVMTLTRETAEWKKKEKHRAPFHLQLSLNTDILEMMKECKCTCCILNAKLFLL